MLDWLTDEQRALRDMAEAFARKEVEPLANQIDRDGYILNRKSGQENSIECKRRADLIINEIGCRQELAGLSHSR